MRKSFPFLFSLAFLTLFLSCKNETKTGEEQAENPVVKEKIILTQTDKDQINSVLAKVMVNPELKNFASALVSTGLTDILMKEAGPFTVFAPTDSAFKALGAEKSKEILKPEGKDNLIKLLKNHIVQGRYNSADLTENVKKGNGKFRMKTIAGTELTLSKQEEIFSVKSGNAAKLMSVEIDTTGFNGNVFVIDAVLFAD